MKYSNKVWSVDEHCHDTVPVSLFTSIPFLFEPFQLRFRVALILVQLDPLTPSISW